MTERGINDEEQLEKSHTHAKKKKTKQKDIERWREGDSERART